MDKDIGANRLEEGLKGSSLDRRVDGLLSRGSETAAEQHNGKMPNAGVLVGSEGDLHDLAAKKQP